jgi:hypothetical protein
MEKALFMGWNKMHVANDDMDVIFRFLSFFDQFRYIIYQILIYIFVNMDYSILNEKGKIN